MDNPVKSTKEAKTDPVAEKLQADSHKSCPELASTNKPNRPTSKDEDIYKWSGEDKYKWSGDISLPSHGSLIINNVHCDGSRARSRDDDPYRYDGPLRSRADDPYRYDKWSNDVSPPNHGYLIINNVHCDGAPARLRGDEPYRNDGPLRSRAHDAYHYADVTLSRSDDRHRYPASDLYHFDSDRTIDSHRVDKVITSRAPVDHLHKYGRSNYKLPSLDLVD